MRILVDGKPVNELGTMKSAGDKMTLKVPRKALGLDKEGFRFEFKFVDSRVHIDDPLGFYDLGVVEPLGRVGFVYRGR